MAAFGSLQSLLEKPRRHEGLTLMESLAWSGIGSGGPPAGDALAEVFGELSFRGKVTPAADADQVSSLFPSADAFLAPPRPASAAAGAAPWSRPSEGETEDFAGRRGDEDRSASPSRLGSSTGSGVGSRPPPEYSLPGAPYEQGVAELKETFLARRREEPLPLQLCTEGLGFESSDDVEDGGTEYDRGGCWRVKETAPAVGGALGRAAPPDGCYRYPRTGTGRRPRTTADFPPPISSIGSSGKPCVRLRSYKDGGRFVLRQVRLPNQELLHASREGGKLLLHFLRTEDEEDDSNDEEELEQVEEQKVDGGEAGEEAEERKKNEFGGEY